MIFQWIFSTKWNFIWIFLWAPIGCCIYIITWKYPIAFNRYWCFNTIYSYYWGNCIQKFFQSWSTNRFWRKSQVFILYQKFRAKSHIISKFHYAKENRVRLQSHHIFFIRVIRFLQYPCMHGKVLFLLQKLKYHGLYQALLVDC